MESFHPVGTLVVLTLIYLATLRRAADGTDGLESPEWDRQRARRGSGRDDIDHANGGRGLDPQPSAGPR